MACEGRRLSRPKGKHMPWTASDAQKHDKSADTPEKAKRWAKTANGVLSRTGNDATAIRVANSRVEGVETFLDRVLSEAQKLKRNVLTRVEPQAPPVPVGLPKKPKMVQVAGKRPVIIRVSGQKKLASDCSFFGRVFTEEEKEKEKEKEKESLLKRGMRGLENIGRAASKDPAVRGERPKFKDNPWAHIVHRAAEFKDKTKEQGSAQTKEPAQRTLAIVKLFGGKKAKTGTESASQFHQRLKWETGLNQTQRAKRVRVDRGQQRLGQPEPFLRPTPPIRR